MKPCMVCCSTGASEWVTLRCLRLVRKRLWTTEWSLWGCPRVAGPDPVSYWKPHATAACRMARLNVQVHVH